MASGNFYSFGSTGCSLPFQDSLSQGQPLATLGWRSFPGLHPLPQTALGTVESTINGAAVKAIFLTGPWLDGSQYVYLLVFCLADV